MDLSGLSLAELRQLEKRVTAEIRRKSDSIKRNLLKQMKKMASDEGLEFNDLIDEAATAEPRPAPASGKRKASAAPRRKTKKPLKYFHPENPKIGWTGHGRKPGWVIAWLDQGKPLSALEKSAG
ncbi:MAG: H-NS histone family protein [Rhodocyclaceae bacterium]|jgi:DNA-binding protein H-NS|nr:H-NS histone family protein [Rhodocyclaceae bacterium]MCL4759309.1 H-NS histone family protein [Rhodocyclaceae bacterium]